MVRLLQGWQSILVLALASLSAHGSDTSSDSSVLPSQKVTLQLKWHHQFQFAGYYAAQAQGYYEQEGLDVAIREGNAQRMPITEVLAGRADYGVSDADVLLAYLQGKPLVALGTIFQHSPYILMTRADSGIRAPSDLRGKAIMLDDEQGIAQIKAMFKREGMRLDAVTVLRHTWNNQDLIDGRVAAISAYSTVEPYQMRHKGVEPGMIRAMDYGIDFYGDTLFTTQQEIEQNRDRVAAFRRASLKGWEYAMAHPEEIIELILKMPGVRDRGITRELLRYEAQAMRQLVLPGLVDIGHMNPGRWETIARIYADVGAIPQVPKSLDSFLFNPDAQQTPRWLLPLLVGLGVIGFGGFWVLLWSLHLKRVVSRRTAELERSERFNRSLIEGSPDCIKTLDLEGNLLSMSEGGQKMLGIGDPKPYLHASWIDLWQPADRPRVREAVTKAAVGETGRFQACCPNLTGDTKCWDVICTPLHAAGGQIDRVLAVSRDITDQKHAEIQLHVQAEALKAARTSAEQAKAVAEDANRAKDHFLAVLSHELRTPLTPVVASLSMMKDDPRLDADTHENLEMIRRNIELEARLIDDLLDMTRITRGKIELNRRPVALCTVIGHAVEVCKPDIEARQLHFGVDIGPSAPYFIHADATRLQQVFWNLLKNAIKFTPQDGCVGIRCRPDGDGQVVVEVNDSGAGIEPEALERIFDAFEQAERSITRQFGGLGLGLAISKALVEMHGGSIEAYSEGKGKGATFRLRLPTIPAMPDQLPKRDVGRKHGAATPSLAGQTSRRRLRILLVEDHGDTARIMKRLLMAEGHEVQAAGDVATALGLVGNEGQFDLLISDLGLPDGSGLDLMRAVRGRGLPLPGIALSGYGQEEDVRRSKDAGFTLHLTKPVEFQRLQEAAELFAA